jgi:hypothetical protein
MTATITPSQHAILIERLDATMQVLSAANGSERDMLRAIVRSLAAQCECLINYPGIEWRPATRTSTLAMVSAARGFLAGKD